MTTSTHARRKTAAGRAQHQYQKHPRKNFKTPVVEFNPRLKGHAGHRENEICDRLAKIAAYAAADTPHKKDAGFFWYKIISKYLPIIMYHVSYPSSG